MDAGFLLSVLVNLLIYLAILAVIYWIVVEISKSTEAQPVVFKIIRVVFLVILLLVFISLIQGSGPYMYHYRPIR